MASCMFHVGCCGLNTWHGFAAIVGRLVHPRSRCKQRCALKFCPVAEMDDLKNEIGMQCLSKHPNIVTLREAFVTKTEVREGERERTSAACLRRLETLCCRVSGPFVSLLSLFPLDSVGPFCFVFVVPSLVCA